MGISNTVREHFLNKSVTALLSTTLFLVACDSGGGMKKDDKDSVNASAQTKVLSEQRGIPVPDATVDFQAGSNEGTDATGQDGIAQFSYDVPESDTPNNVSIRGNSPEIQEFSQIKRWQPEVRTESITREQRRNTSFNLNTSTGSRPVNASYTVLDNKGDGDGGDLTLADGRTGSDGSTTINFDYLSLTDSVHVKASRSSAQPSIEAKTTTIDDLEPAVVRDTVRTSPTEPTSPSDRPDRVKRLKQEDDQTMPKDRSERKTIADSKGQPPLPVEVNLQKQKRGITTTYSDQHSQTTIDTTVAIHNLDDLTLTFNDQQPDEKSVTLQGSLTDTDTDQGYNGGSITIKDLDDLTERTAFTNAHGDFETTFNETTNTFKARITTDVDEYTEAIDTVTVTPPLHGSDTTITAPTLSIQRDTYDALITADGNNDDVAKANGELIANGETLTTFTTTEDGTAAQSVQTTSDSITGIVNKAGWREGTATKPLGTGQNINLNPTLSLIEYTVNAKAKNESGDPVDVNVTVDDKDGNTLTQSTGSDGQTTFEGLNVADGFKENEQVFLTYNNDEYNAKQDTVTLNPDNTTRSSAVTLNPSQTTVNYAVTGDVTSTDGDTVTNATVNLNDPEGTTVATDNTDTQGTYETKATQTELDGDQGVLASNPPGYESFKKEINLSKGTNTEDITLQEILRDYTFDVNQDDGDALTDATVDIDEAKGKEYRDITELTTDSKGETTTTISDDEGVVGGETLRITIDKAEYNPVEFTHTVNEETKEFTKELTEQTTTVTATINGDLLQEGIPLPNTKVTARNADTDTTVTTLTSDGSGAFSLTTSYPDNQAYTLNLISNTPEHQGDTTTVELQGQTSSYNPSLTLQRKLHKLTITTDDANTNNPVNASGTITHDGTTLANYTTGSDGESTVSVETLADQISVNGDTENYDGTTQTKSPNGAKYISSDLQLPPITYTWTGDATGPTEYDVKLTDGEGNQVSKTTINPYTITGDTNNPGIKEDEQGLLIFNAEGWVADTVDVTANPDNRTKTKNITLTQKPATVNATLKGETLQEGQTLPNANVTIRNRDADTTVTTLTSDETGYYETTTSYPDNQAYTAQIVTNTPEHAADTTTVTLGTTEETYTNNPNLERLIYTVTTTTDDANTNNPVNASGTITHDGTTLANYTTGSNGETTVRIKTGADQVTNRANTANYDPSNETLSLNASKTVSSALNLPPITYVYNGQVTRQDGTTVSDASVILNDDDAPGQIKTQTGSNGNYTLQATPNDGFEENDASTLTANKQDYNPASKNTTTDPQNRTKTLDLTVEKQSTTDRITITFNDKTVGGDLYSNPPGDLTYQVSTNDTTFTATGSTTADVPISDGDQLEISQSDSEYISTFMVNNTDTEQPPMQVTPFPAEPDYQSTSTVSIDKSNVVNEYQVTGIPDTSPEGYNTIDDWKPHLNQNDVRRWTDLGGLTSLETYILEGSSEQWENKADEVVPEVQPFLPFTVDGPTYVTESELQDIFDERDDRNIARFEEGPSSFSIFTEGDYLQNTAGKFSEGDNLGTVRSEVYGAYTGMDETGDHFVTNKILDNNEEFISDEATFPIRIIYSTESPTNIY